MGRALLLLAVAAIFHRPLIRFIAIRIAAHEHLALDFHISGTLLTNLTITGVHVAPNGTGPSPVEKIEVDRIRFDYSLPMLARHGFGEFLRSYELHHADLVFVALPSRDKSKAVEERKEKLGVVDQIRAILAQPAAYADRAEIEDFNIRVRLPENEVVVKGVDLLLAPDRLGYLRVGRIAIPGLPTWEKLAAETSYEKRNLFIKNLQITPDLILQDVNFDASQRAQHKGGVSLHARVFGGDLSLSMLGNRLLQKGENLEHSYDTTTRVSARNINLRGVAEYFGAKDLPVESLASLDMEFSGEPEKPQTWTGSIVASIERIAAGRLQIERAGFQSSIDHGDAKTQIDVALLGNTLKLTGTARLPASVNEFGATEGDGVLELDATHLAELSDPLGMTEPLKGAASAEGRFGFHGRRASAELRVAIEKLTAGAIGVETARMKISVSKSIGQPGLSGLTSDVGVEVTNARFGSFNVDSATLRGSTIGNAVTLKTLDLTRGENSVSAQGSYEIPRDLKEAAKAPIEAQIAIKVPVLQGFGIVVNGQPLEGHINGAGTVKYVDGVPVGGLSLDGAIKLGDFSPEHIEARVKFADREAKIEELVLKLGGTDHLAVVGTIGLDEPNAYAGTVSLGIKNLTALQPLLAVFGVKEPISGSLGIEWDGKGAMRPAAHDGNLKIEAAHARYGAVDLREFRLAGKYGAGFAEASEFRVASGITLLEGRLDYIEGKLRLREISLMQGGQQALTGYIILPFDLANKAQPIPLEERIAINLNATSLKLEKLITSFGQTSPIIGELTASLVSGGTLLNPAGQLKLKARGLKAKAAPQFDNAELDLELDYTDKILDLNFTARQREIQPLTIVGKLPLDIEKAVKEKAYDPALPIYFELKLPPSSLVALPKFVPAVRRLDGTMGLDVTVGGTYGDPAITAVLAVDLKGGRMTAENVPAIGAFKARVGYANGVLSFDTFKGELGGGTFKLSGTIKATELNELSFGPKLKVPTVVAPLFDLRLESDEVLVVRDDSITVRADADVKLEGPLNAASATGTIYVVHSRFFKEIDILPIGLPGRPKPAPKSAPSQTVISFPEPPLRDWKFDIAIKTRDDDPFGIRGNLANGSAALALRFAGTGLKPWLDGNIRVENFTASLPFSSLSVTRGFVYFKEDEPFQPVLDIQAESTARDYVVGAYIYGTARAPEIQLSSEPPLPHADIVSLLATGTTTAELGANAEVLASRAAMLALKELYQKVFKRGSTPPPSTSKTSDGNLLDRFEMELGGTDNRSGRQQVIGRYKINDRFYIMGDAGVDGQVTGRLKYLIRFR